MKRAFSLPAALIGLAAMLSVYASTGDTGLSLAVYLGLVSLNLAIHSAAQARAEAGRPEPAEGRASQRRGRSRRHGSFPELPDRG